MMSSTKGGMERIQVRGKGTGDHKQKTKGKRTNQEVGGTINRVRGRIVGGVKTIFLTSRMEKKKEK